MVSGRSNFLPLILLIIFFKTHDVLTFSFSLSIFYGEKLSAAMGEHRVRRIA